MPMFVLSEERIVEWPVKVHVVKDGKAATETFVATWRIPEMEAVEEGIGDGRDNRRTREFLQQYLIGWSGVVDTDRAPIPYSDEAKAQLFRWRDAVEALVISFDEALRGGRRKN